MTFDDWLRSVPPKITNDAIWRMVLYRQALFLGELAWNELIVHIIRQLLNLVPAYRGQRIREETALYKVDSVEKILDNVPMPED